MYVSLLTICLGIVVGYLGRGVIFSNPPNFSTKWLIAMSLLTLCLAFSIKRLQTMIAKKRTVGLDSLQGERSAQGVERYQAWNEPDDFTIQENNVAWVEKIQADTHLAGWSMKKGDNGGSSPVHDLRRAGLQPKGRKVRVQKMRQKGSEKPSLPIIGFELDPPRKGMEYRVLTAQGIFKVPALTDVYLGYVRAKDSFFSIDVLEA